MDKELPTAEELLKNNFLLIENNKTCEAHTHLVVKQMIEFAKIHVKQALKEASEKALTTWATTDFYDNNKVVSKNSILKSYPLTNIK